MRFIHIEAPFRPYFCAYTHMGGSAPPPDSRSAAVRQASRPMGLRSTCDSNFSGDLLAGHPGDEPAVAVVGLTREIRLLTVENRPISEV